MYKNVINKIKEEFPAFQMDDFEEDDTIVIICLLTAFIIDNIDNKNIVNSSVKFINSLCESDDIDIMSLISEIAIGLYDANIYGNYSEILSSKSTMKFDKIIESWEKANG